MAVKETDDFHVEDFIPQFFFESDFPFIKKDSLGHNFPTTVLLFRKLARLDMDISTSKMLEPCVN